MLVVVAVLGGIYRSYVSMHMWHLHIYRPYLPTYAYGVPYVFMALDHFGFPSSVPIPRLNPSRFHFSGPVLSLSCPYKLEYKTLRKVTG